MGDDEDRDSAETGGGAGSGMITPSDTQSDITKEMLRCPELL
jgi:hypothetical protein